MQFSLVRRHNLLTRRCRWSSASICEFGYGASVSRHVCRPAKASLFRRIVLRGLLPMDNCERCTPDGLAIWPCACDFDVSFGADIHGVRCGPVCPAHGACDGHVDVARTGSPLWQWANCLPCAFICRNVQGVVDRWKSGIDERNALNEDRVGFIDNGYRMPCSGGGCREGGGKCC